MKKYLVALFLILISISAFSVPQQIYFQGILLDSGGDVITGTRDMTFRLYDVATGGTALATDPHTGISISGGLYTVKLGIDSSNFNGNDRYIGITVGNDSEMTPRVQVLSVPYVYNAANADSAINSDTVNTIYASSSATANYLYPLNSSSKFPVAVITQGPGSGLDSDTLDGYQASDFALSSGNYVLLAPSSVQATDEANPLIWIRSDNANGRAISIESVSAGNNSYTFYSISASTSNGGAGYFSDSGSSTSAKLANANYAGHFVGDVTVEGDVYANNLYGDGSNLTGVVTSGASGEYVLKGGDEMTGTLTIGVSSSGGLRVITSNINGTAVYGRATAESSVNWGGDFRADGVSGIGVRGLGGSYGAYFESSSSGSYGVYGRSTGSDGYGIYGTATAGSSGIGAYGRSTGSTGRGVHGETSATGDYANYGGYFQSAGNDGAGVIAYALGSRAAAVYGDATRTGVATNYGGYFIGRGNSGTGVYAHVSNASGIALVATNEGGNFSRLATSTHAGRFVGDVSVEGKVYVQADALYATAIHGKTTHNSGDTYGGYFESSSATSGTGTGVYGWSSGLGGRGVVGLSGHTGAGAGYGGYFVVSSEGGASVYGVATAATGLTYGGYFKSHSASSGRGVYAQGVYGVEAVGVSYGLRSTTTSETGRAVYGAATNASGANYGGYFTTASSAGYGLFAHNSSTGWAAWFGSKVRIVGTLEVNDLDTLGNKNFLIDHPLDPANKTLKHAAIEGPEMKNMYDGTVVLNNDGKAVVKLPSYFEALNKNYRYQLTTIGGYAPVYIAQEIKDNMFAIAGGKPGMKVSWLVIGIRNDAYAKDHPYVPEEEKSVKGTYLYPAGFDK